MAGQVCPKCEEIIKAGESIIYEDGKPIHYPKCPLATKEDLKKRLIMRLKEDYEDERSAVEHYRLSAEMAVEAGLPYIESILNGIADDEERHRVHIKKLLSDLGETV